MMMVLLSDMAAKVILPDFKVIITSSIMNILMFYLKLARTKAIFGLRKKIHFRCHTIPIFFILLGHYTYSCWLMMPHCLPVDGYEK